MSSDPIDELSARLFDAARQERLPDGAQQRALLAARRELAAIPKLPAQRSNVAWWSTAAAGIALAAGVALFVRHREPNAGIRAEPARSSNSVPSPHAPAASQTATPVASASAPPAPLSVPNGAPVPVQSAPASLTDELGALKLASSALNSGDPRAALAALDRYDHVLKGKVMRAEATLLRIEALARTGQAGAASALAQRFVEQNPGSPLVDRARSFVQQ